MTWEGSPWLNCSHWWDGGGWFLKCYKVKPLRGLAGLCNLQHVAATSVDETDGCTWWCKHQSDPPGPVQHMKFPFWPQQVACGTNPTTTTTTLVHKAATQFTNGYKVWFQTLLSHWVTMHNNNEQQMGSSMPTNSLIRLDPGQMRTHAIILSWWIRCGTLMVLWFCVVVGHGTLPLGPWPILILFVINKDKSQDAPFHRCTSAWPIQCCHHQALLAWALAWQPPTIWQWRGGLLMCQESGYSQFWKVGMHQCNDKVWKLN